MRCSNNPDADDTKIFLSEDLSTYHILSLNIEFSHDISRRSTFATQALVKGFFYEVVESMHQRNKVFGTLPLKILLAPTPQHLTVSTVALIS